MDALDTVTELSTVFNLTLPTIFTLYYKIGFWVSHSTSLLQRICIAINGEHTNFLVPNRIH